MAGRLRPHAAALGVVALAVGIGQAAALSQPLHAFVNSDSLTYVGAAGKLSGSPLHIDAFRTAGYPFFLQLVFKLTGGVSYSQAIACYGGPHGRVLQPACQAIFMPIVLAQALVVILTTFETYVLVYRLAHRRLTAALVASVLALDLYVISWELTILTELLSYWAVVTVFLVFERFVRRPQYRQAVLMGVMAFIAVLVKPFNVYLSVLLLGLLLVWALWRQELQRYWKPVVLAGGIVAVSMLGYSALDAHMNGFFGVSFDSNITTTGKVMEYHIDGLSVDPQYRQVQAMVVEFTSPDFHSRFATPSNSHPDQVLSDSGLMKSPFTLYDEFPSLDDSTYSRLGGYAQDLIKRHFGTYLLASLPDIYLTWHPPLYFYAPYAMAPDGSLRPEAHPLPGLPGYRVWRFGVGSARAEPFWVDGLLVFSSFVQEAYWLLPLVLVGLGIWVWRRPRNVEAFLLLLLAVAVVCAIVLAAMGNWDEFYRIRFPVDWAMIAIAGVALVEAGVRAHAWRARRRAATSATSTAASPGQGEPRFPRFGPRNAGTPTPEPPTTVPSTMSAPLPASGVTTATETAETELER
jgi:hypothetical protein